jgi:hypothetical protein
MVLLEKNALQAESGATICRPSAFCRSECRTRLHPGDLGGFTFVGHGSIFANAMAGSIVYLGMEVLSSPARPNFRHPPPLFMFMLGIWAAA